MPPGTTSKRSKKKKSRNIPPPVMTSTDIKHSKSAPIDSTTSHIIPPKYKRKNVGTSNSYRYQTRGPPRKALPPVSQTPQPTSKSSFNRIPQIYNHANETTPPLPLEMSQTSHVDITQNIKPTKHLNKPNYSKMKKTLSTNDIMDYVPVINTYNRQNTLPQYKNINANTISHHRISKSNENIFIPPTPQQNGHNIKKKSNGRGKNPSMGAMKQLIERAETFGQTARNSIHRNSNSNQIHSNQAPQIPDNNSIFDENDSDNNMVMEYKQNHRQSIHLPENNPPPTMTVLLNGHSKDSIKSNKEKYIRENSGHNGININRNSNEMKINQLKDEINELEMSLKEKRNELSMLEKEKLESCIECMKPITLLKRLNQFCDVANNDELDIIQCILEQSV